MASQEIEDLYTSLTTPYIQGTCKDCGNGTLNNTLNPAFELVEFEYADGEAGWLCNNCGSAHLDLL